MPTTRLITADGLVTPAFQHPWQSAPLFARGKKWDFLIDYQAVRQQIKLATFSFGNIAET